MQVVILAGGFGSRLSEETDLIPKPMVRIGQDPIILHLMKFYASYGHTDFVIALGYKGHVIKDFFANYIRYRSDIRVNLASQEIELITHTDVRWKITLIDTGEQTLTGGRLLRLKDYLEPEFMLTYGDGLSNVNLDSLYEFHKLNSKIGTVTAVRPPARFGSIEIKDEFVTSFSEKNPQNSGWINGGFFCFKRDICDYIPGDDFSLEGKTMEDLVENHELVAFTHEGFWQPMDTLREKRILETLWEKGEAPWLR